VEVILDFLTVTSDLPLNIDQVPFFKYLRTYAKQIRILIFLSPFTM